MSKPAEGESRYPPVDEERGRCAGGWKRVDDYVGPITEQWHCRECDAEGPEGCHWLNTDTDDDAYNDPRRR